MTIDPRMVVVLSPRPISNPWTVRIACAAFAVAALVVSGCGPKTNALAEGSRAPEGPRVSAGSSFVPRVGDFSTIELFIIDPVKISEASAMMISQVLPVIRSHGGLRDVWLLRNDTLAQLVVVSAWADPVQFQQWQISRERLDAYQKLGPFMVAQPSVSPVSMVGLISEGNRR